MSEQISAITQICIVVENVETAQKNWAVVLGVPEAAIEIIFPDGIEHVTYGKPAVYNDCRVAKYQLQNIIIELIEPGEKSSPWRDFLEKHGTGVFHVCMFVQKPDDVYERLTGIGVGEPYHIGTFDSGFYSYVAAKEQLGIELSINHLNQ